MTASLPVRLDEWNGTTDTLDRAKRFEVGEPPLSHRKGFGSMDLRVYEIVFQFNQGLDQALTSLGALEKIVGKKK